MAYTRTTWQNSNTPLSAANMNNIEDGIEEAMAATSAVAANLYPVGSIHITDQNVNPGTALGGTWELIDKRFSNSSGSSGFSYNNINTENGTFTWVRKAKSITFRLNWANKIPYDDAEDQIGTFNISSFGLSGAPYMQYVFGQSDGFDCVLLLRVNYSDGVGQITVVDTIYKYVQPTHTGASFNLLFDLMFTDSQMSDAACNQFVWRRTA